MASSTANKRPPCASCTDTKATGIFTCGGCSQAFCMRHAVEHKQILTGQMDELVNRHDQFRQTFVEQKAQPQRHPLIADIDEWERVSIAKIQQTADQARQQLMGTLGKHTKHISEALQLLTEQINKARDDDDYVETDLKQWLEELEKLKAQLAAPSTIEIREEKQTNIPFVSRLSIHVNEGGKDTFEKVAGNLRIEDNGQVVVHHGSTNSFAVVRGKNEYRSGKHKLRLRVEYYGTTKWILFGVIAHEVVIQAGVHQTPSVCGWGGQKQVFVNGIYKPSFNSYNCDIEVNDTIELFLNCDDQTIRLTNERTKSIHTLTVDLTKCPFPWHFHLNLYQPQERVRILSSNIE